MWFKATAVAAALAALLPRPLPTGIPYSNLEAGLHRVPAQ